MLEKDLRRKMVKAINDLPVASHARSVHGSPHSAGEPDIDAVIAGVPVKIEVKLPGNRPTDLQSQRLSEWEDAGAVAGWVDTMKALWNLLLRVAFRTKDKELASYLEAQAEDL